MKEKNIIFDAVLHIRASHEALKLLIFQNRNNTFRKFYNTTLYVNDHSVNRFMEIILFLKYFILAGDS